MLTPTTIIDAVQDAKRSFTDNVITEPAFNKAAHAYIDAQTVFAKMLVNNFNNIIQSSMENYSKNCFPTKVVTA